MILSSLEYAKFNSDLPSVKRLKGRQLVKAHLGMGTQYTWHGAPDARCHTVDLVSSSSFDVLDDYSRSSTTVDSKYRILDVHGLSQVVGHAVVSSFLHMNANPGHSHLVPAIMINAAEVAFAFYDALFLQQRASFSFLSSFSSEEWFWPSLTFFFSACCASLVLRQCPQKWEASCVGTTLGSSDR